MQMAPGERGYSEMAVFALGCLQLATLIPYSRRHVIHARLANERSGMGVLLDAASGSFMADPEVSQRVPFRTPQ